MDVKIRWLIKAKDAILNRPPKLGISNYYAYFKAIACQCNF